jgi:hypothetical protein
MEHGHYHDPVLILYLMQFVAKVISSNLEAAMDSLTVGGQRRRSLNTPAPPPGVVVGRIPTEKENFGHQIVKWRWRWKARRRLGHMNQRVVQLGKEPLDGILMGHTHVPDFHVFRLGGLKEKIYANTGDWVRRYWTCHLRRYRNGRSCVSLRLASKQTDPSSASQIDHITQRNRMKA